MPIQIQHKTPWRDRVPARPDTWPAVTDEQLSQAAAWSDDEDAPSVTGVLMVYAVVIGSLLGVLAALTMTAAGHRLMAWIDGGAR